MSEDKELVSIYHKWRAGEYPYDTAIECNNCVTQHVTLKCDVAAHQPLVEEAKALGLRPPRLREKYAQFFEEKV